jgi:hypothetical protein
MQPIANFRVLADTPGFTTTINGNTFRMPSLPVFAIYLPLPAKDIWLQTLREK